MKHMTRLLDVDNKYKLILIILLSCFVLVVVGAIILSQIDFKDKVEGTIATVINDGDLIINYVDGDNIEYTGGKEQSYGISITNNSNSKIYYSIYFEKANLDNIDIVINDSEGKKVNQVTENILDNKLINLYSINGNETVRYYVVINSKEKIKFKGTLKVVNESLSTETFSDLILLNNSINMPQTRIGAEVSTIKEGLLSTNDNKGISYYFRGVVDNNYLRINDTLFRIVRINGDNTVRVVLNDVLPNQYVYNTNVVVEGTDGSLLTYLRTATILNNLNSWYQTVLKGYDAYIAKGDFCTDSSFNLDVNGIRYSSAYDRIFNDEAPELYCTGDVYTGKVGLLSVDEIVFAGAASNKPNTSYYLYNKDIPGNYLTSSSYFVNANNSAAVINVMSNGAIGDGILVTNPSYVRPVININVDTKIKGEGTLTNPYIIVS